MRINTFAKLLSIPKTLYVNLKVLPFSQAVRMPIFVYHKTKLAKLDGKWKISTPLKRFMIQFGMKGAGTQISTASTIEIEGLIQFNGSCSFGGNCQVCVSFTYLYNNTYA